MCLIWMQILRQSSFLIFQLSNSFSLFIVKNYQVKPDHTEAVNIMSVSSFSQAIFNTYFTNKTAPYN